MWKTLHTALLLLLALYRLVRSVNSLDSTMDRRGGCVVARGVGRLLLVALLMVVCFGARGSRGASPASITAELEMRPPRLMELHSARGFPARVHLFEPVRSPASRRWTAMTSWLWRQQADDAGDVVDADELPFSMRVVTVDLLGGITKVGEYYTRITVGGQAIRVQVDTGSSTLAFPVAECETCQPSDLRYNPRLSKTGEQRWISCVNPLCARDMCSLYGCTSCSASDACCADENPAACMFALKYGDGSGARGGLMVDTMAWGNVSAPVVFGAILKDTENFERALVDGILGMAYKSLACNPTCVEPPFQQMVKAGVVEDEFSICITPQGGKLVLGAFDHELATSNVSYVPLALSNPPTFYTVNVSNALWIGGRTLNLPDLSAGIVDSGTTLIVVSDTTFRLLLNHLLKFYCEVPGLCKTKNPWFQPASCVALSDTVINKLPTLKFSLGDKNNNSFILELKPDDYMLRFKKTNKDYRCVGIMKMKKMQRGTDIIFGNTIMQRYVTHYDRRNKRMGFAEAKAGCGGTTRCASYTQCSECASVPGCSFDFRSAACRDGRGGLGLVPYPECSGSSCFCKLGPRAGLVFGIGAGVIGSALAATIAAFVLTVYYRRGRAGSDVGRDGTDHAPLYPFNDDDDEFGDRDDTEEAQGDLHPSKRYMRVPSE